MTLMDQMTNSAGDSAFIIDVTTQSFMDDVIEASKSQPVIVDFWAPWCGPCKSLMPILEQVVTDAGGAVKLCKVNIDENQAIAAQLRVQSVPTVYAFIDGQPVDGLQERNLNQIFALSWIALFKQQAERNWGLTSFWKWLKKRLA